MTYPIYDLQNTNGVEPVNLKQLERDDENNAFTQAAHINDREPETYRTGSRTRIIRNIAFLVGFFLLGGVLSIAFSRYYTSINEEVYDVPKRDWFEFQNHVFFTEKKDARTGDIVAIDTNIKSEATAPMWVFVKVITPLFEGESLYEPIDSSGQVGINGSWVMVEEKAMADDLYMTVYRLIEPLQPLETSPPLMRGLRIVEMDKEAYSHVTSQKISLKAYAGGIDEEANTSWNSIKIKFQEDF